MSIENRVKKLTLVAGGETFDNIIIRDWSITHTLNNKIFTFPQFIEAYVSRREANGFNISFTAVITGDFYDMDALRLRKALLKKDVCKIMLPLGQKINIKCHLIGFNEKWSNKTFGSVDFDVEFHTTTTENNAPSSELGILDQIDQAFDDLNYLIQNNLVTMAVRQVNDFISSVANIKNSMDYLIHNFKNSLQINIKNPFGDDDDINYNAIKTSIEANPNDNNLLIHGFNYVFKKEEEFEINNYIEAFNYFSKNSALNENLPSKIIILNLLVNNMLNNSSLLAKTEKNITKKDVLYNINQINSLVKRFIVTVHQAIDYIDGYFEVVDIINKTESYSSLIYMNLEKLSFNSKTENSIIIIEYMNVYKLCYKLYPEITKIEELEEKAREIEKINDLKGEALIGFKPNTTIHYLK